MAFPEIRTLSYLQGFVQYARSYQDQTSGNPRDVKSGYFKTFKLWRLEQVRNFKSSRGGKTSFLLFLYFLKFLPFPLLKIAM